MTTRGSIRSIGARERANATTSCVERQCAIDWRLRIVGRIISSSPRSWARSASAGEIHRLATVSPASWVATWPLGAPTTKNRVSKRRGGPTGVTQCARYVTWRRSSTRPRFESTSKKSTSRAFRRARFSASSAVRPGSSKGANEPSAWHATKRPASSNSSRSAAT